MMKTIFAICGLVLVVGGVLFWRHLRLPNQYGTFIGVQRVEVKDLIERPKDFLHKTVGIEGEITKQSTTMGCYFFFPSGDKLLRVDISEIAMTAPRRNGHRTYVEGQLVPYQDGYQFWASAAKIK
jgi:hypothetical protein